MGVPGLGKVDNMICMVLEWTPEEASLLQDRPSLLQHQSTSQGNMRDSELPDILYETCACIIHTINLQLHVHYNHDQSFLLHLKIASETPNHQLLGTQGPRDRSHDVVVYETCACVNHTNLLSYMCI